MQREAEHERDGQESAQAQHRNPILHAIDACNASLECFHGMSEGKPRVDRLEEGRRHLDGEDAARSAKLHHKRDDRDSFTHVSKTGRERIDDVRENDRAEYACQQIEPEVFALNTHEEDVPNAEYDPL